MKSSADIMWKWLHAGKNTTPTPVVNIIIPTPPNVVASPSIITPLSSATPTKQAKRKRFDVTQVAVVEKKLADWIIAGKKLKLKKNCKLVDNIIIMMCVLCLVYYPRTPQYFRIPSKCKFVISSLPGHESLESTCTQCTCKQKTAKRATREGVIKTILEHYPLLTSEWIEQTLTKQNGRGLITNYILNFTTNGDNCIGVHRYDNDKEHTPDNCFLEVQELNVPQLGVILCLKAAWVMVFQFVLNFLQGTTDDIDYIQLFRKQYKLTPQMLGITWRDDSNLKSHNLQCRDIHFKSIIRFQIQRHVNYDIKRRGLKLPTGLKRQQFIDIVYETAIVQLEKQNGRCHLTNIGLTHTRAWNQMSFERVNNELPHFTADGQMQNCVFICRLFNAARQVTTRKILEYFLQQQLIAVPDDVRSKVQSKLDSVEHKINIL